MQAVSREQLKKFFKKVKHLRLPVNLESLDFEHLHYFAWIDESDDICYLVTEDDGTLVGLRGEVNRMPTRIATKHMCSICLQQREFNEVMLFTTKNKRLPKGVEYRVSGVYICTDYQLCNKEMKNESELKKFIWNILFG